MINPFFATDTHGKHGQGQNQKQKQKQKQKSLVFIRGLRERPWQAFVIGHGYSLKNTDKGKT
ncbi:hypothetical protein FF32_18490 [Halomonas campaniensis]|nr:hypothetical protein FF32_18490 [Halomonas campaniensis]